MPGKAYQSYLFVGLYLCTAATEKGTNQKDTPESNKVCVKTTNEHLQEKSTKQNKTQNLRLWKRKLIIPPPYSWSNTKEHRESSRRKQQ